MNETEIEISAPQPEEFGRVGELVYLVDPFIYPALFGSQRNARRAMPGLMGVDHSPFAAQFVDVARIGGRAVGVLVSYPGPFERVPDLSGFWTAPLGLPPTCRDVCERYLEPLCRDLVPGERYVSCVATDPAFRGRGVASSLLRHARNLADGMPLVLDVLKDNVSAVSLYRDLGFVVCSEHEGYSPLPPAPALFTMRLDPQDLDDPDVPPLGCREFPFV